MNARCWLAMWWLAAVLAEGPGVAAELRQWTSLSGASVRAELVRKDGKRVGLERPSGKQVAIQRSELSDKDQAYLDQLMNPEPARKDATVPKGQSLNGAIAVRGSGRGGDSNKQPSRVILDCRLYSLTGPRTAVWDDLLSMDVSSGMQQAAEQKEALALLKRQRKREQ